MCVPGRAERAAVERAVVLPFSAPGARPERRFSHQYHTFSLSPGPGDHDRRRFGSGSRSFYPFSGPGTRPKRLCRRIRRPRETTPPGAGCSRIRRPSPFSAPPPPVCRPCLFAARHAPACLPPPPPTPPAPPEAPPTPAAAAPFAAREGAPAWPAGPRRRLPQRPKRGHFYLAPTPARRRARPFKAGQRSPCRGRRAPSLSQARQSICSPGPRRGDRVV